MEKLKVIKTLSDIPELIDYIKSNDVIAFDTETTGVKKADKIIGFSVSAHVDTGYYVILSKWDVPTQTLIDLETKAKATEIISLLIGKQLIMHNAVFDCAMVENNFKIKLIDSLYADTMILGHLLNENRQNGLKELGTAIFGEDSKTEQAAMQASILANGGEMTRANYELYKADAELIGKYGAKDTILTIKLFYHLMEQLYEEGLDTFFFEESMPLVKGPTYDLNTTGLKVDTDKLVKLKGTLEAECLEAQAFIEAETTKYTKEKFKKFNPSAGMQLAWLLFHKLGNEFGSLTDSGKEICNYLDIKIPYSSKNKREFIAACQEHRGEIYKEASVHPITGKTVKPKKIEDYWKYTRTDKTSLKLFSEKYKWVAKLLELSKNKKILNTYVIGIGERQQYGIIHPSFLQHGTTSGRYSSKNPNFQNLPRNDKRVKSCIIARDGKVFVGADYAQLEPRVFASIAEDDNLINCFSEGKDFYSVVGAPIFGKHGFSLVKDDPNSFAKSFPHLRDKAKVIALATPYGRTASFTASEMGVKKDEAQELMNKYFEAYPRVELMMLISHEMAKSDGVVRNLFGRPRRIPEATKIVARYGHNLHKDLPYEARTLLNLAMNHRIQSTGASIMNRAAIACHNTCKELSKTDSRWSEVKIVMQIHDEMILEGPDALAEEMTAVLKDSMENTVKLPRVALIAEPKVAKNLAELK
jgi:DNA polymerase-1